MGGVMAHKCKLISTITGVPKIGTPITQRGLGKMVHKGLHKELSPLDLCKKSTSPTCTEAPKCFRCDLAPRPHHHNCQESKLTMDDVPPIGGLGNSALTGENDSQDYYWTKPIGSQSTTTVTAKTLAKRTMTAKDAARLITDEGVEGMPSPSCLRQPPPGLYGGGGTGFDSRFLHACRIVNTRVGVFLLRFELFGCCRGMDSELALRCLLVRATPAPRSYSATSGRPRPYPRSDGKDLEDQGRVQVVLAILILGYVCCTLGSVQNVTTENHELKVVAWIVSMRTQVAPPC